MNVLRFSLLPRSSTPVLWLCLFLLAGGLPAANAARASREAGLRLLQAQLPTGGSLRRLDCDHLTKAVHAASLAHRKDAVAILSAALTLDEWDARRKVEERLSCVCVSQIFQAAVSAAPEVAATLLQTSEALYPECANALTAALQGLVISNQVAVVSRDAGSGNPSLAAAPSGATTGDAGTSSSDGTGNPLTSPDGTSTATGPSNSPDGPGSFGLGLGTGFPGSPGFSGSTGGSGGVTLPSPVGVTATATANK